MSVYNRKLFKNSRPARDMLNQAAGIMASSAPLMQEVQRFKGGGTVTPSFGTPIELYNAPRPRRVGVTADGRSYTGPARGTSLSNAAEVELATKALEGGLGSLSAGEQAYLGMLMGGDRGRLASKPITDYLGDSVLSSIVEGAAGIGGNIVGGITGAGTALITGDESDPSTLAGRMAELSPPEDYLQGLGFNIMDKPRHSIQQGLDNLQSATALGRPAGVTPTTSLTSLSIPGQSTSPQTGVPDGEEEYLRRQEESVRAMGQTDPSGAVYFDEETSEYRPGLSPEIQQLIDKANRDKELAAADELQGAGVVDDESPTETETETETTDDSSPTGSTREERTDTDPAANMTVPQPKPKNFAEVVAQAKAANAAQGVPKQDSDNSEIQTAVEKGTGSSEDLKAEFLKLLPKYEADPSVMGLNIALMGFTIASGDSPDALENFSEGMKKTLPNFIKDAKAKKAYERETDLLASKYVIQRKEADRTRAFSKDSYYASEDFIAPDGRKIVKGTHLRLNDDAFEAMGGAPLVDGTVYRQQMDDANELAKAKIAATKDRKSLDDYYLKSPVKKDLNENVSVNIVYPTREGLALNLKPQLAGGVNEWTAATAGYVQDLEAMARTDNALEDAIKLAEKGALGTPGLLGKLADSARGWSEGTPVEPILKAAGLEYGVVSEASEFENLNRIIALQSARIILNEGGKMISNQEREQVARSLGFADATYDKTTDTMNLGSWKNVFTNKEQAIDALKRVQRIIRDKAEDASKNYARIGAEIGYEIGGLEEAKAAAPGLRLQEGDDGKFYLE